MNSFLERILLKQQPFLSIVKSEKSIKLKQKEKKHSLNE